MSEYKKGRINAENLHREAYELAFKYAEKMPTNKKLAYHHTPFL
jgi:hypothetical protein